MKTKENQSKSVEQEKGSWETSRGGEALQKEEPSRDVGESGQIASGGHCNQPGVNTPRRSNLGDDELVPPQRRPS